MTEPCEKLDLEQLVAQHHRAIYRYAYRLSGSEADAEDLTQQAFLTLAQKSDQIRDAASTRSWLHTVLRHAFLKTRRKKAPLPAASVDLDLAYVPEEMPEDEIDREGLQHALDALPPDYRVVVVMFYFDQLAYREIAEELDIPIGTVMSRLSRAKSHLRSHLFRQTVPTAGNQPTDA